MALAPSVSVLGDGLKVQGKHGAQAGAVTAGLQGVKGDRLDFEGQLPMAGEGAKVELGLRALAAEVHGLLPAGKKPVKDLVAHAHQLGWQIISRQDELGMGSGTAPGEVA